MGQKIFEPIWKIDAWIVDRFQSLADLAYTHWETSPYAIAAQAFSASVLPVIVVAGAITLGIENHSILSTGGVLFMSVLVVFSMGWEAHFALTKHRLWLKNRLPVLAHDIRIPYFRLFWLWMFTSTSLGFLFASITIKDIANGVWETLMFSAFYFLSCQPPKRIEKKQDQDKLVPSYG